MQRERVTDDIYVFTSDRYAQVTAGVVATSEGAVVIDTLVYPEETRIIRRFVEERLEIPVRYVINTHFHADHTTGTCFFPDATVVAHERTWDLLDRRGRESLERARVNSPEMRDVVLVLPDLMFDSRMVFRLGDKTFRLWSSPGHSADSIVCLVEEDQVLFAADTLMPIPHFVDGNYDDLMHSLHALRLHTYECVVQGHGEVVLRGEIPERIQDDIDYMLKLSDRVEEAINSDYPESALESIDVESCGKSRILLNGLAQQLHRGNVLALAEQKRQEMQAGIQNP